MSESQERMMAVVDARQRRRVPRDLRQVGRRSPPSSATVNDSGRLDHGLARRADRRRAAAHRRPRGPGLRPALRPPRRPGRAAGRRADGRGCRGRPSGAELRATLLQLVGVAEPGRQVLGHRAVRPLRARQHRAGPARGRRHGAASTRRPASGSRSPPTATGATPSSTPTRARSSRLAEAYRNVAATGAKPLAVTNCLNFGSPEDPEVMWQFTEAVRGLADGCLELGVPVTGGNVSFYNQTGETAILPTPGGRGARRDRRRRGAHPDGLRADAATSWCCSATTRDELGGSEWAHVVHGHLGGRPPAVDLAAERALAEVAGRGRARGPARRPRTTCPTAGWRRPWSRWRCAATSARRVDAARGPTRSSRCSPSRPPAPSSSSRRGRGAARRRSRGARGVPRHGAGSGRGRRRSRSADSSRSADRAARDLDRDAPRAVRLTVPGRAAPHRPRDHARVGRRRGRARDGGQLRMITQEGGGGEGRGRSSVGRPRGDWSVVRGWVGDLPAEAYDVPSVLDGWTVGDLVAHLGRGLEVLGRGQRPPRLGSDRCRSGRTSATYPTSRADRQRHASLAAETAADPSRALDASWQRTVDALDRFGDDDPHPGRRSPGAARSCSPTSSVTRLLELVVHADDLHRSLPGARGAALPREAVRLVVRALLDALVELAPGHTVEVRVPPFAAVQCLEGPRHTRGTPPQRRRGRPAHLGPAGVRPHRRGPTPWPTARCGRVASAPTCRRTCPCSDGRLTRDSRPRARLPRVDAAVRGGVGEGQASGGVSLRVGLPGGQDRAEVPVGRGARGSRAPA